jgi:hypothetical protein
VNGVGYNLAVFAWREDLSSHARRKKSGVSFAAVYDALCDTGTHPALASVDFKPFMKAVVLELGDGDDAPYTVDRLRRALMFRVAYRDELRLVPKLGALARKLGLTSVGER